MITTPTKATRPRCCTFDELKRVGVVLIDEHEIRLGRKECGREWSPMLRKGGRLSKGYWRCPEECNGKP